MASDLSNKQTFTQKKQLCWKQVCFRLETLKHLQKLVIIWVWQDCVSSNSLRSMLTWRGLGVFCCICGHFLEFFPVCFVCLPFPQQGGWEKWWRGKGQHGWGSFLHPGMWPAPPDPLPNNVIIRKLEKERVHLGGRNSRIKETKHRPSEGDSAVSSPSPTKRLCLTHQWQNDCSLSQRRLK